MSSPRRFSAALALLIRSECTHFNDVFVLLSEANAIQNDSEERLRLIIAAAYSVDRLPWLKRNVEANISLQERPMPRQETALLPSYKVSL